ncbi:ThiF family adenylyltransferase [Mesorhizobium sp. M2E.F.Ca.ET.209.01.1.1]|uniref:ThiF family adenylyltransferase n=1 Tax=Mesorhizobium sp. M2E.F.Ca.ET.209.01.1.1 TaxID=2500526 RepID=UPI000FD9AFE9|nr:ThiF family adenylyltransferase [Mesorhizobium sp. M2E.F.Ca.ET.209.01.1.1]TGS14450.1 ThiF family adenylyltransferase [Mesorhizobium sp. M2E.F.Ca.ET.209.01.1.1]
MACGSEFRELANRNRFVQDLEEQGYLLDFVGGYFLIYGLPYLNERGELAHGDWASPVDLSAEGVLDSPKSHQAWFRGGRPHDQNGRQLRLGGGADKVKVAEGFETDSSFSYKLLDSAGQMRSYISFEEKVQTYIDTITGPALAVFPDATPLQAIKVKAAEQGTPLRFPDTLSARYHMNDVSRLLEGKRVAIVGLGGTGSYILDFIARTHLAEIALFDDDKVHVHTIFRFPGFIQRAIGSRKVDALGQQYGQWHANITAVPEQVTKANVERLRSFDFVFLAIDHGASRIFIADWLSANGIPFVDCGMGLNRAPVGLNGVVRVTGVDRAAYEATARTVFLPGSDPEGGEYRRQGQIAELNALDAALAVVRFKQHFAIYDRLDEAPSIIFETSSFEIDRPVSAK